MWPVHLALRPLRVGLVALLKQSPGRGACSEARGKPAGCPGGRRWGRGFRSLRLRLRSVPRSAAPSRAARARSGEKRGRPGRFSPRRVGFWPCLFTEIPFFVRGGVSITDAMLVLGQQSSHVFEGASVGLALVEIDQIWMCCVIHSFAPMILDKDLVCWELSTLCEVDGLAGQYLQQQMEVINLVIQE